MKRETALQSLTSTYITTWQVKVPKILSGLALLLTLPLFSCEDLVETSEVNVPTDNDIKLSVVDLPLEVSNFNIDSLVSTSNNNRTPANKIFFGVDNDENVGKLNLYAYGSLDLLASFERSDLIDVSELIEAKLHLGLNDFYGENYFIGQRISVQKITDQFSLALDESYKLYDSMMVEPGNVSATESLSYSLEALDSLNLIKVELLLNDNFGNNLLSLLKDEDINTSELKSAFPGLAFSILDDQNQVQSIDIGAANSYLDLVIKNGSDTVTAKFVFSGLSFTGAKFEPAGLMPENYKNNPDFELNDNESVYYNSLVKTVPRIDISSYFTFMDTIKTRLGDTDGSKLLINYAELYVENPDLENIRTSNTAQSVPASVYPYFVDNDNFVKQGEFFWGIQRNFTSQGQISDQTSGSNPNSLALVPSENKLSADITLFLQELYQNPDLWSSENDVILNDQVINLNSIPFKPTPNLFIRNYNKVLLKKSDFKLRVYYSTFDN